MTDYMRRALRLARSVQGTTSPNPPVGAVLMRDGRIVGEGATQPPGGPHAEVVALQAAGEAARGAILYATLEPCSYKGRTPPCAEAVVAAGVAEVHIAQLDANPRVAGGGVAKLEAAGLRVVMETRYEAPARELNEAHAKFIRTGLPFVTAKFAASLDGRIATRNGDSQWITGPQARNYGHRLRASVDAIITGVGTVLADDPHLTARPGGRLARRQPLRVVLDSRARTPPSAAILRSPGRCLIAVGGQADPAAVRALEATGAEVVWLPAEDGRVDLRIVLDHLAQRGCTNLLLEAGGELTGAFLDQGRVDKLLAFIAPLVIGGAEAIPAVAGQGAASLAAAHRLHHVAVQRLGPDLLVKGYLTDYAFV